MKAAVINLYIEQGTDWTHKIRYWTDTARTVPVDFSGATGACKIRDMDGKIVASPVVTFEAGTIVLAMSHTVTSGIVVDGVSYDQTTDCTYDVEVTSAGVTQRWANGVATISPEVTK